MNKELLPNIIVGVPTGSSPSDATVGFARASRRVKQLAERSPFSMDELTAALAVLEKTNQDSREVRLCVPADPSAIPDVVEVVVGGQRITDPAQIVLAATAYESSDSAVAAEKLASAHLVLAINALFEWDWEKSLGHARDVLRLSTMESARDEALNLSAIALYMSDRPDEAASALRKAVEGQWNIRLRTNLAAMVMHSRPAEAAAELAYLVGGATSSVERLEAARNAVYLWRKSRPDGQDDEDSADSIPASLRDALRGLVVSDISEEDFWEIGQFVARTDADWVRTDAFLGSSHCDTPSACLVRLRTVSFEAFIHELARRSGPKSPEWVNNTCEEFVLMVNKGLLDDFSSSPHASFAVDVLRGGLDASTEHRVLLRVLLVYALQELIDEDGEPLLDIIGWLGAGRSAIKSVPVDAERRKFLEEQVGNAYNVLGQMFGSRRQSMSKDYRDVVLRIAQQLSTGQGRRTANMDVIRQACRDIRSWADDTLRVIGSLAPHVHDSELRTALNGFMDSVKELRKFADQHV